LAGLTTRERADMGMGGSRWWVKTGGVTAVLVLLLTVLAMKSPATAATANAPVNGYGLDMEEQEAIFVDIEQKDEIFVVPPRESCSKETANCMQTKCCKTTNYRCYQINSTFAQCIDADKGCTKGMCAPLMPMQPPAQPKGLRLFCFTMYTSNTGSTKKNTELDLIRTQLHVGASVFGCKGWAVYSDVKTWISPGPPELFTTEVSIPADAYFAKRKIQGTWVNSLIFVEVWKKMQEEGEYKDYDWVVKADADAVFLPARLLDTLKTQPVTDKGIYLENCKKVMYGFFGNLEVFSVVAFQTLLDNVDDCKNTLDYKGNNWKFGPWGEDLLAQKCMDLHGVSKVWAFELSTDGMCEANRPEGEKKNRKWKPECSTATTPALHPFKDPADYFNCLLETQHSA